MLTSTLELSDASTQKLLKVVKASKAGYFWLIFVIIWLLLLTAGMIAAFVYITSALKNTSEGFDTLTVSAKEVADAIKAFHLV